jgi:SAM-dependent methyltransferase
MPYEEFKASLAKMTASTMWSAGDYEPIAALVSGVHEAVIEAAQPRRGESLLDVATGTGAVAILAARAGAEVTGLDFAPGLIGRARQNAGAAGLDIRFDEGDAEALPYDDASFDAVVSSLGTMFAPDHEAVAGELARVCKPGGRLVLASWMPEGGVFDFFQVMRSFQPPPPAGLASPFDWGRPKHVEALLGDAFELGLEERDAPLRAPSGEYVWRVFSTSYGPTRTLAESLDDDRREELHRAWVELHERSRAGDEIVQSRPFLLVRGRRLSA